MGNIWADYRIHLAFCEIDLRQNSGLNEVNFSLFCCKMSLITNL